MTHSKVFERMLIAAVRLPVCIMVRHAIMTNDNRYTAIGATYGW